MQVELICICKHSLDNTEMVWYGILEFNVPLDIVYVISETGGPEQWCAPPIQSWGASDITPLTRAACVYNGPKGMELAPNPRYSGGS